MPINHLTKRTTMFSTNFKSLVGLCCLISLTALSAVSGTASAKPTLATASLMQPAPLSIPEGKAEYESGDRAETDHPVLDDTEQPNDLEKTIVMVVEVFKNGIRWFEAETLDGSRYKVSDLETNASGSGHGVVQIGSAAYYVDWG